MHISHRGCVCFPVQSEAKFNAPPQRARGVRRGMCARSPGHNETPIFNQHPRALLRRGWLRRRPRGGRVFRFHFPCGGCNRAHVQSDSVRYMGAKVRPPKTDPRLHSFRRFIIGFCNGLETVFLICLTRYTVLLTTQLMMKIQLQILHNSMIVFFENENV